MNRNAKVTMNEGSRVWMTICPLMAPISAANTIVAAIAIGSGRWASTSAAAKASPAKAIIEPIERSNSPPIIRRAAAIARIPSCGRGGENRHRSAEREHGRAGGEEKEDEDDDQPGDRPEFRPAHRLGQDRCLAQPFVDAGAGVAADRGGDGRLGFRLIALSSLEVAVAGR